MYGTAAKHPQSSIPHSTDFHFRFFLSLSEKYPSFPVSPGAFAINTKIQPVHTDIVIPAGILTSIHSPASPVRQMSAIAAVHLPAVLQCTPPAQHRSPQNAAKKTANSAVLPRTAPVPKMTSSLNIPSKNISIPYSVTCRSCSDRFNFF